MNIALVQDRVPVLGVIYVPARKEIFYAVKDKGAFRRPFGGRDHQLQLRGINDNKLLRIVASRSHPSPEVTAYVAEKEKDFSKVEYVAAGSSLKFCLLAEGKADVYPRLAPTMEWDTGAGHIIAKEAGAEILVHGSDRELSYNKENLLNPYFIVKDPALK